MDSCQYSYLFFESAGVWTISDLSSVCLDTLKRLLSREIFVLGFGLGSPVGRLGGFGGSGLDLDDFFTPRQDSK